MSSLTAYSIIQSIRDSKMGEAMQIIHHVTDIDATLDAVWAAITTQAGLASWWTTKVTSPQAQVGTSIHFTFNGDFNPVMQIVAMEPQRRLEWKCVGGHDYWADNTFAFELDEAPDKRTRLRFWQYYTKEVSEDAYGIYNFNWGYFINSLVDFCETGTGTPAKVGEYAQ
jgi:uncharacterized protein YndB with AHSA1/START domain